MTADDPRRIKLPVSWARTITDPRPPAEITPALPIPATLGADYPPRRQAPQTPTQQAPTMPRAAKRTADCGVCVEVDGARGWTRATTPSCPVHGVDAQPATKPRCACGHPERWHGGGRCAGDLLSCACDRIPAQVDGPLTAALREHLPALGVSLTEWQERVLRDVYAAAPRWWDPRTWRRR